MSALLSRSAKLEAARPSANPPARRAFECVVRKGCEEPGCAEAYAALGLVPQEEDLEIILVAVTLAGQEPRPLRPSASVLALK